MKTWQWIVIFFAAVVIVFGGKGGSPFAPATGPRDLLIVHESGDTTPDLARVITALRTGTAAQYLAEKKHTLTILDDEATDADGKPAPLLEQFKPYTVPELLIIAPPNKVLKREPLPASADGVLSSLKANGG